VIGQDRNRSATTLAPLAGMVAPPDDPGLHGLVEALCAAGRGQVRAILLYGSHVQASEPDRFSAYDLIVAVDGYREFYDGLAEAGRMRRAPGLMAAWSNVLLPTSVSFDPGRPDEAVGKCQIVSQAHLARALGPHSKDHFLKGRTVQRLALVWARGQSEADAVLNALRQARADTVRWVRPYLSDPFTPEDFGEAMLRVSYAAEIRPESSARVSEVFEAQRGTLVAIADEAIATGISRGEIVERDGAWAWRHRPGFWTRAATAGYFARSKARATLRWGKHIATYEDWPFYIVRKLERRAGLRVEVTEREKRWPFVFLWPKLFLVLRELRRGRRPGDPTGGTSSA
jgi:hypothetical protein